MHVNDLLAAMRRAAAGPVDSILHTKIGFVTSYDPQTYAVRVRLEPESSANEQTGAPGGVVETNWIPLLRSFGGNGWGAVMPPKANPNPPYGDMCLVLWPDGGHGVALAGFYNDIERIQLPGTSYPSADAVGSTTGTTAKWGEAWWTGPKGNFVRILNDGSVRLQGQDSSKLVIDPSNDGTVELRTAGGSYFHTLTDGKVEVNAAGSLVGIGAGSYDTSMGGIVTKQDLQTALTAINAAFALRQGGTSANPGITPTASTTVFVSH